VALMIHHWFPFVLHMESKNGKTAFLRWWVQIY